MSKIQEKIKIIAIVRYDDSYAYVLNRPVNFQYTKIDRETIIGEDEGLYTFYRYDIPSGRFYAFGGREFELPLTDGSVEKCYGQWWDGMSGAARELFEGKELCHFSCACIDKLKQCYVYYGCSAEKEWMERLISEYDGEVYGYFEYAKMLREKEK